MIVVYGAGRHPMEAADNSKTKGIILMPTVVSDPSKAGGVKVVPKTGKESLRRTIGLWQERS